jgi:hypothetical protein
MELFLLYLWLKLPEITLVLGSAAFVTAVLFVLSKLTKEESSRAVAFEDWIKTEAAKTAGATLKYLYTAKELYKLDVPLVETKSPLLSLPKRFSAIPIVCGSLFIALPNQTETAVLVGASIALDVSKSPEGQKIGTLLRAKANELLDNELNKLNKPATK